MSISALVTMLSVQLLVSTVTFYFIFRVLRKSRPNKPSGTPEQF